MQKGRSLFKSRTPQHKETQNEVQKRCAHFLTSHTSPLRYSPSESPVHHHCSLDAFVSPTGLAEPQDTWLHGSGEPHGQ